MLTDIYWIALDAPGRLGIMPRPRGDDWLEDEIRGLGNAGVDVLVSLLTSGEERELLLLDERSYCEAEGMAFHSLPIPDRSVLEWNERVRAVVDGLARDISAGRSVAVHCRMGIGRASIVAALVLIRLGVAVDAAFDRIEAARGRPVPDTPEQREWVERVAAASVHFADPLSRLIPGS